MKPAKTAARAQGRQGKEAGEERRQGQSSPRGQQQAGRGNRVDAAS
jgi:hypothetical protein